MREGMCELGQQLLTATKKVWRVGQGLEIFFCSGYSSLKSAK